MSQMLVCAWLGKAKSAHRFRVLLGTLIRLGRLTILHPPRLCLHREATVGNYRVRSGCLSPRCLQSQGGYSQNPEWYSEVSGSKKGFLVISLSCSKLDFSGFWITGWLTGLWVLIGQIVQWLESSSFLNWAKVTRENLNAPLSRIMIVGVLLGMVKAHRLWGPLQCWLGPPNGRHPWNCASGWGNGEAEMGTGKVPARW